MYAHKIRILAEPSTDVVVRLPPDFPSGVAEVIVLAEEHPQTAAVRATSHVSGITRSALLERLAQRIPADPALAAIVFYDDPAAPLDENDWPGESRP
jgi:hypothetical protein